MEIVWKSCTCGAVIRRRQNEAPSSQVARWNYITDALVRVSTSLTARSRDATLIIHSIASIMRTPFSCFLPALRKNHP